MLRKARSPSGLAWRSGSPEGVTGPRQAVGGDTERQARQGAVGVDLGARQGRAAAEGGVLHLQGQGRARAASGLDHAGAAAHPALGDEGARPDVHRQIGGRRTALAQGDLTLGLGPAGVGVEAGQVDAARREAEGRAGAGRAILAGRGQVEFAVRAVRAA